MSQIRSAPRAPSALDRVIRIRSDHAKWSTRTPPNEAGSRRSEYLREAELNVRMRRSPVAAMSKREAYRLNCSNVGSVQPALASMIMWKAFAALSSRSVKPPTTFSWRCMSTMSDSALSPAPHARRNSRANRGECASVHPTAQVAAFSSLPAKANTLSTGVPYMVRVILILC